MSAAAAPKRRWPLAEAEAVAQTVIGELQEYCERIEIAGSIRRRVELVADVEIVARPLVVERAAGLFAEFGERVDLLHEHWGELVRRGVIADSLTDAGRKVFGRRYKRGFWGGVPVDLFVQLPPSQWGVLLALRTGSAEFSHSLVVTRDKSFSDRDGRFRRGLLPAGAEIRDNCLFLEHVKQDTPEETTFFLAAGIPWVEPEARR